MFGATTSSVHRSVEPEADDLVDARKVLTLRAAAAGHLLSDRHSRLRVLVRDVTEACRRIPVRQVVDDGSLSGAVQVLAELPHARGAGCRIHVVLGDEVAVPEVGVARGAVSIEEHLLGARLQVDDAVVLAVAAVDVFLDDEPAAALVDLALVVVALGGDVGRAARDPRCRRRSPSCASWRPARWPSAPCRRCSSGSA